MIEHAEHFYDSENKHIRTVGTVQDITKRKKIDSILTSVFQVIPDLLFIMKDDGTIVDYRAQKDSDLYVEPNVFLNHKVEEVLPPHIGEAFRENLKKTLDSESLQVFEYKLEINGVTKHFEARMAKIPIGEHIMAIVRDTTEKERLFRQYETIFNIAREGIFLHELDGTMIDVNPYLEKFHNRPRSEIIGLNVSVFFNEEDIPRLEALFEELFLKGYVEFEMELKKLDGTPFFASIKSYLSELDGRQIIQGTLKDLTLELNNELLLSRSERIFQNLQEGVVITDKNGRISEVNRAFKSITGYSYDDAIGNNMSLLKSGLHSDDFYQEMWHGLQVNLRWAGKVYNKKKNGEEYTSFLTISTINNNEGIIQNYIGIFTDISDVLRYEKELREKDIILIQQSKMAAMGEMIDNIAHQWKQPLNLISLSNGLIKLSQEYEMIASKQEVLEAIDHIDNEVKHLSTTIDDFRNFFKPDKTKREFLIENCIASLIILIQSRLKKQSIQIIKKISTSKICSIENELVQVLMNIVNNAIDALGERPLDSKYICIETYKEKESLYISIKDNAGGIPLEIQEQIFESRFTTKEEGKGTGIGLYMSRQIMESLGGTLICENVEYRLNDQLHKGANFIIKIPQG